MTLPPTVSTEPETTFHKPLNPTGKGKNAPLGRVFLDTPVLSSTSSKPEALITHAATVHHLRNVLRASIGQTVIAVDPTTETASLAEITDIQRQSISLKILQALDVQPETLPTIALGMGLIKSQRWDWMLQKVTELGIRQIYPLETHHAVVHIGSADNKKERWNQVIRSAAEQCESVYLPQVNNPGSLAQFINSVEGADVKIVLMERESITIPSITQPNGLMVKREPFRLLMRKCVAFKTLAIAIGPEGGWSEAELGLLIQHGFKPVSLGSRILRAETAALAALSAVVYECND